MGLTVDFSMGFVCFDAASKVGVRRSSTQPPPPRLSDETGTCGVVPRIPCLPASPVLHSVRFFGGRVSFQILFFMFLVLPADNSGRSPSQSDSSNSARYWSERGEGCHIVGGFWPRFLEASVFLKDATHAARALFTERNAQTTIICSLQLQTILCLDCLFCFWFVCFVFFFNKLRAAIGRFATVFELIRNSADFTSCKKPSCNLLAQELPGRRSTPAL